MEENKTSWLNEANKIIDAANVEGTEDEKVGARVEMVGLMLFLQGLLGTERTKKICDWCVNTLAD